MDMKTILEKFNTSLTEARSTLGADINEIMFGLLAAGNTWEGFINADEAQQKLEQRLEEVSPQEVENQIGRARAMLADVLVWAAENGWDGNVTRVWWTARPGVLSQAVGKPVSAGNPTDILLVFGGEDFLGISAKSTKGKGDIGFKNPGVGSIARVLGIDLMSIAKEETTKAISKLNLPKSATARKRFLREKGNETVKKIAEDLGRGLLNLLRESLYQHLKTMDEEAIRNHLTTFWIDAKDIYPYYVKVTGRGTTEKGFSATVEDPIKNEKYKALMSEDIEVVKVGADSIGIMAGGRKIMKMRFKYESQQLASSLKMSGDPWK